MRGKIIKAPLCLITLLSCLLMVSTVTALPAITSESIMKIVDEHDEIHILIEKSCLFNRLDIAHQEKQKMNMRISEFIDFLDDMNILKILILVLSVLLTIIVSPIIIPLSFVYGFIIALTSMLTNDPPDIADNLIEVIIFACATVLWVLYFVFLTIEVTLINIINFIIQPNSQSLQLL